MAASWRGSASANQQHRPFVWTPIQTIFEFFPVRCFGNRQLVTATTAPSVIVFTHLPALALSSAREQRISTNIEPRFDGQDESTSDAVEISRAERALASRVLDAVEGPLLYARVDMAPGPDGDPLVMELELIEPSLFFAESARALERFVAGVLRRSGGRRVS